MTLVCCALPFESVALRAVLPAGAEIFYTGMGAEAAAGGLRARISRSRPQKIISTGFAGALASDLKAGDLILAENLSSVEWVNQLRGMSHLEGIRIGTMCSAAEIVDSPASKLKLRQKTGAAAVDMESTELFRVACEANIPMLTVRSISDDAESDMVLPPALLQSAAGGQWWPTAKLITWVGMHPSAWRGFSRFVRDSHAAQRSLQRIATLV